MLQLIVFDLDGILIDSTHNLAGAVNSVRASMNLEPLETPRYLRMVGNGIDSPIRRAVADTEIDAEAALKRMTRFYADHLLECAALCPGVSAGLRELRASGVKLAVLTNKPASAVKPVMAALKIDFFFDDILCGDGTYPLKPEPDALLALREKYRCRLEGCWFVGRNALDMEAGHRAGFHCFLLNSDPEAAENSKADYIANSFAELVTAIKRF